MREESASSTGKPKAAIRVNLIVLIPAHLLTKVKMLGVLNARVGDTSQMIANHDLVKLKITLWCSIITSSGL